MWDIVESDTARKQADRLPRNIAEKYEHWCAVVTRSGPQGLRAAAASFQDEKLRGEWAGFRSSRLNKQWRVIYSVEAAVSVVRVDRVWLHDY